MNSLRKLVNQWVIDHFHKLFYRFEDQIVWRETTWCGVPTLKCPLDLWVYQEILYECRPDKIIECGTYRGGTALFLACICDQLNNGEVITIDQLDRANLPDHRCIHYIHGDTTSSTTITLIRNYLKDQVQVMVILDSSHEKEHVNQELEIYSQFVSRDQYLIVEDTNLNGHPVWSGFGPGPWEAVQTFLSKRDDFVIDKSREKYLLTFNPGGYLRRIR